MSKKVLKSMDAKWKKDSPRVVTAPEGIYMMENEMPNRTAQEYFDMWDAMDKADAKMKTEKIVDGYEDT